MSGPSQPEEDGFGPWVSRKVRSIRNVVRQYRNVPRVIDELYSTPPKPLQVRRDAMAVFVSGGRPRPARPGLLGVLSTRIPITRSFSLSIAVLCSLFRFIPDS